MRIHGTRRDGSPMEMRGVIINGIREGDRVGSPLLGAGRGRRGGDR